MLTRFTRGCRSYLLRASSGFCLHLLPRQTMPLQKIKDPFRKFKETLSKYLPSSPKPTSPAMAALPLPSLGKRLEPPTALEITSQSFFGGSHSQMMFPKELSADLALFNNIFAQLHMKCRACNAPLALDVDSHLQTWLDGTQVIPPSSQISVLQCPKCDHLTCVGCGGAPKLNKHHFFTTLGVVRILLSPCPTLLRSIEVYRSNTDDVSRSTIAATKADSLEYGFSLPDSTKQSTSFPFQLMIRKPADIMITDRI